MNTNKPLVSLVIAFYNQENYVKDTIKGALSQTYDNLEIILSDDCSTDGTFTQIEKWTCDYIGPHKIIINRNECNLGLVPHVNKILFDLANGRYIFLNGGDDISLPNRVVDGMNYFLNDSSITALTSPLIYIDNKGNEFDRMNLEKDTYIEVTDNDYLSQASFMWGRGMLAIRRETLDYFGPLNDNCQTEDSCLRFRSLLLGKVVESAIYGVKYRVHGHNMSIGDVVYKLKTRPIADQYRRDLEIAKERITPKLYSILKKKIAYYEANRMADAMNALSNSKILCLFYNTRRKLIYCMYKWTSFKTEKIWKHNLFSYLFSKEMYNFIFWLINKPFGSIVVRSLTLQKGNQIIHENFGDDLNFYMLRELTGKTLVNYDNMRKFHLRIKHYSCIGSVFERLVDSSTIVWGTGAMYGDIRNICIPKRVYAVRGPLTRKLLLDRGILCPEIYGDPALLLPLVYCSMVKKEHKIGLIPHYIDFNLSKVSAFCDYNKADVYLIRLWNYRDWKEVIDEICSCECIVSSSLHGLIVADAYNIPNVWIKLSENVSGGSFKYLDYLASVGRLEKSPLDFRNREIDKNIIFQKLKEFRPAHINFFQIIDSCPFIDKKRKDELKEIAREYYYN